MVPCVSYQSVFKIKDCFNSLSALIFHFLLLLSSSLSQKYVLSLVGVFLLLSSSLSYCLVLVIVYREIKVNLSWKLSPSWLVFRGPEELCRGVHCSKYIPGHGPKVGTWMISVGGLLEKQSHCFGLSRHL